MYYVIWGIWGYTGEIDGAIDDIIACQRLGRHVGQGVWVLDMLFGTAIEPFANAIGIAGSLEHPPTKEQLQRLVDEADNLPPEADLEEKLRFDRFRALDSLQALAHGKDVWSELHVPDNKSPPRYFTALGFDWNVVAKRFNEHYDTILAVVRFERTSSRIGASFNLLPRARSEKLADDLASLLLYPGRPP